jgi:phosphoserine phosphatase RsbU/P
MNILVAEDDAVARQLLVALLQAAGHSPTAVENGHDAWGAWLLARSRVVISDWQMPEVDGLELCRRVRRQPGESYTYFILLTSRSGKQSYLAAMDAGVDDFITKPIDPDELKARLQVAERILGLREELHALEGLLPICSYCKRIRDDQDNWSPLEGYIEKRSEAQFSHGICPECYAKYVQPQLDRGANR